MEHYANRILELQVQLEFIKKRKERENWSKKIIIVIALKSHNNKQRLYC